MPFPSSSKDPKPAMEERHSKQHSFHNGKDINIVIAGVKGVGKSALTVRYLTRRFIGDYDSQIEAVYSHSTVLDGKSLTVHIIDTAWQENCPLKEDHVLWADAVLLVYSITDKTSFEKLREIADFVLSKRPDDSKITMALVATKCDLIHMQEVTDVEVTQFCAEYNCLHFETSSSESYTSVMSAINGTCRQVRLTHRKREKLLRFMQNPAVAAKLQIRNSLKSLTEMKWRSRAPTM